MEKYGIYKYAKYRGMVDMYAYHSNMHIMHMYIDPPRYICIFERHAYISTYAYAMHMVSKMDCPVRKWLIFNFFQKKN